MRKRNRLDPDAKKIGRNCEAGGWTVIKIVCMKKKHFQQKGVFKRREKRETEIQREKKNVDSFSRGPEFCSQDLHVMMLNHM